MLNRFPIVIGFLFATAIWSAVFTLHSDLTAYGQICEHNQAGHKDCTTHHIILVVLWHIGKVLDAISPAITAIATAVIGFFTYTLWTSNQEEIRHQREIERAYISGGGPLAPDNPNILLFTVDNYGKTPAVMLEYAVAFCPLNAIPPTPAYDAPNFPHTTFTDRIPPGTMGRPIARIPIPPNMPRPLLVYGRYWFFDIWQIRRTSGFVLVIAADGTHGHVPPNIPHRYIDWS
jgi:hypothetical protein